MDEDSFVNDIIKKAVSGQQQAQMSQANFAIKRDVNGKLEYSVNGFNPQMVVLGFKALQRAVEEEGL